MKSYYNRFLSFFEENYRDFLDWVAKHSRLYANNLISNKRRIEGLERQVSDYYGCIEGLNEELGAQQKELAEKDRQNRSLRVAANPGLLARLTNRHVYSLPLTGDVSERAIEIEIEKAKQEFEGNSDYKILSISMDEKTRLSQEAADYLFNSSVDFNDGKINMVITSFGSNLNYKALLKSGFRPDDLRDKTRKKKQKELDSSSNTHL